MLDFTRFNNGEQTFADLVAPLTPQDMRQLTNEMVDTMRAAVDDIVDADVTFVPVDEAANDTFASDDADVNIAWTLGHVIVHTTASAEEGAALGLVLARGLPIEGRSRYETPWETVHTVQQVIQRLEESRRMRLAMLDAWPDEPHLDNRVKMWESVGEVNAIGRFVIGLLHDDSHVDQIREVVRQAKAARG